MIVVSALVIAAAALVAWSGVEHLAGSGLGELSRAAGAALGFAQILVGTAAIVAVVTPLRDTIGTVVLACQACLYTAFLGYLSVRLRQGRTSNCGCTRLGSRVGPAGLVRAGALAAISAVGAVAYSALPYLTTAPTRDATLMTVAGVAMAALWYVLPSAIDGWPTGLKGTA